MRKEEKSSQLARSLGEEAEEARVGVSGETPRRRQAFTPQCDGCKHRIVWCKGTLTEQGNVLQDNLAGVARQRNEAR